MNPSDWTSAELLHACLDTNAREAWAEFVLRYQPLIAGVIGRIAARYGLQGRSSVVDDLVQETYLRICRKDCRMLERFKPESEASIFGYLKTVAASVALDHFRAEGAGKRGPQPVPLDDVSEHRLSRERSQQAADVEKTAMEHEIWDYMEQQAESSRDAAVFRLYYGQGFTAKEIAALAWVGLSNKGVESCLARLAARIRNAMRGSNPGLEGERRQVPF